MYSAESLRLFRKDPNNFLVSVWLVHIEPNSCPLHVAWHNYCHIQREWNEKYENKKCRQAIISWHIVFGTFYQGINPIMRHMISLL